VIAAFPWNGADPSGVEVLLLNLNPREKAESKGRAKYEEAFVDDYRDGSRPRRERVRAIAERTTENELTGRGFESDQSKSDQSESD